MRIVLSGGGTGGHVTPILTIALKLKESQPTAEVIYIGEDDPVTNRLLKASGLKQRYIKSGKWRRYHGQSFIDHLLDFKTVFLNVRDLFRIIAGFAQSLYLLIKERPDVVFVKGGYVGLPVGIAAWVLAIPVIIHESDAAAGLTNRILAHLVRTICVSWPPRFYTNWQHKHLVFSGNPIRQDLLTADAGQARRHFELSAQMPVVLVVGGSLGAKSINQTILDHLEALVQQFQIIHISGTRDHQRVKKAADRMVKKIAHSDRYHLYDFLNRDFGMAYAAADIVVSRAGMSAIAEIAALSKPAIIIPQPYLPAAHQLKNAELLERHQAAIVLQESEMGERLVDNLIELSASPEHQRLLKQGLAKIAKTDADSVVAGEILALV